MSANKKAGGFEEDAQRRSVEDDWSVEGRGTYPKQRALQGKALSLEAVGQGPRPAGGGGGEAGCRRE